MLSSMPASENISFEKIVIFQPHNFTCLCTSPASCGITLISCIHKKNTKTYCSVGVGWIFPVCMELNHWRNQICLYLPPDLVVIYVWAHLLSSWTWLFSKSIWRCLRRKTDLTLFFFNRNFQKLATRIGSLLWESTWKSAQTVTGCSWGLGLQNLNLSIKGAETWGPDAWELVIHSSKQQYLICASI